MYLPINVTSAAIRSTATKTQCEKNKESKNGNEPRRFLEGLCMTNAHVSHIGRTGRLYLTRQNRKQYNSTSKNEYMGSVAKIVSFCKHHTSFFFLITSTAPGTRVEYQNDITNDNVS